MNLGRLLIIIGIIFIVLGISYRFIGQLPGDFRFKKGNVVVYIPLMTSIVISIVLSLLFYLINKFK